MCSASQTLHDRRSSFLSLLNSPIAIDGMRSWLLFVLIIKPVQPTPVYTSQFGRAWKGAALGVTSPLLGCKNGIAGIGLGNVRLQLSRCCYAVVETPLQQENASFALGSCERRFKFVLKPAASSITRHFRQRSVFLQQLLPKRREILIVSSKVSRTDPSTPGLFHPEFKI